jgi:hypothetical protein
MHLPHYVMHILMEVTNLITVTIDRGRFVRKCRQQTSPQVFPTEGNFEIYIWRNYSIDTIWIEAIEGHLAIDVAQKTFDRLSRAALGNIMHVGTKGIVAIVEGVATATRQVVFF